VRAFLQRAERAAARPDDDPAQDQADAEPPTAAPAADRP
jgi:hypothetical protein